MSDELPQGWTRATLDEIRAEDAPIIYGILQPGPDVDGGVPYVRPTEIVRDEIQVGQLRRTSDAIANKYQRATLRPGDVVFTIVGSIGKAALVPPELAGANITQSSSRIRPKPSVVEPLYLKFALKSPGIAKQCEDFKLGTAVPRLNLEDVRKLGVSLAPLAEQQRIVAKLEKLLSLVDSCRQRLAKILALLKRFRQAVLAAACPGRLTTDWREDDTYDDDLPAGWRWMPLQQLLPRGGIFDGPFGSNLKSSDYTESGVRVIRLENVGRLRFIGEKETFVSREKYKTLEKRTVCEGDIIFASFISEEVRACVLPKLSTKAIAKADCFCLRPDQTLINNNFLAFQLVSQ